MITVDKIYAVATALVVALAAEPAFAGEVVNVPEPGVLGLLAMGVVGAVMVAHRRK